MRNTKRSIQSAVTIDGVPLIWRLHREQNWTDDQKAVGLAIHVEVVGLVRRELYLEYPAVQEAAEWQCDACIDHPAAHRQPPRLPLIFEKQWRQAGTRNRGASRSCMK